VQPLSLKYLAERGDQTQGLQSQSWDEFEDFAPHAVITLCDHAAGEACPAWFGNAVKQHWGLSDPSKISASEAHSRAAFYATIDTIEGRIGKLLANNSTALTQAELAKRLADLERLF
jgi:arsenate reductase